MDKLNKITRGFHDLGNLEEGGQGLVRKIRRHGEILSAIKRFPFTFTKETPADKHFARFQKRLSEIEEVNRAPHPHVVQFLSSGITDTGDYPYIEMELVEGQHLSELQRSRFNPVFPIKEILKVADHLSAALAHWHGAGVIHGDVESRNVKYHVRSGNYILVNFGWPSFEQQAVETPVDTVGAREGLAPEQVMGQLVVQTDIYHFGVIMFQLVVGQSFFKGGSGGDMASGNRQSGAYLGTPPHEFLMLRKKAIPLSWPTEKLREETVLPEWFVLMIYKCLEKDPEARFDNGMLLHQYILENSAIASNPGIGNSIDVGHDNERLLTENLELKASLEKEKRFYKILHRQWKALNDEAIRREHEPGDTKNMRQTSPSLNRFKLENISRKFLIYLLSGVGVVALIAGYLLFGSAEKAGNSPEVSSVPGFDTGKYQPDVSELDKSRRPAQRTTDSGGNAGASKIPAAKEAVKNRNVPGKNVTGVAAEPDTGISAETTNLDTRYKVKSKAYFYNLPYEETRRNAFIIHWNNAVLSPLEDKNGFIYIVFTNHLGQTSRGWLRKKDLNRIN